MADRPTKPKIKTVSDWINRPYREYAVAETRHTKLWRALSAFIHNHGGFLVTPPAAKTLRIEVVKNSTLPTKLADLGYNPRHCGVSTRIVSGGFAPVDIIEISLGK